MCKRCGQPMVFYTVDQRYCEKCEREVNQPRTYGVVGNIASIPPTNPFLAKVRANDLPGKALS